MGKDIVTFLFILLSIIALASGSTVSIPVCEPGDSRLEYRSLFQNCQRCCTYSYGNREAVLRCNPEDGVCLLKAPLSNQQSSHGGTSVYILFQCNSPKHKCNIPAGGTCSMPSIATAIGFDRSPKRIMCAFLPTRNVNARCIEIDLKKVKLRAKNQKCTARVGRLAWLYGINLLKEA